MDEMTSSTTTDQNIMIEFVKEIAGVHYQGYGQTNGYQPYAKWVANDLFSQISSFGNADLATFDGVV
jgi:hypothetical protein